MESKSYEKTRRTTIYLPEDLHVHNPYFPNDSISVRMLLTHKSSIRDNWNVIFSHIYEGDSPIALDDFLVKYLYPSCEVHLPGMKTFC